MYSLLLTLGAAALVAAAPTDSQCATQPRTGYFTFPLPNGFPQSTSQLMAIEKQAHGSLPNGPLPGTLSDTSAAVLEVIATNELFEVAYFTDLVNNMTSCVKGYRVGDESIESIHKFNRAMNYFTAIIAQEELHAIGANAILSNAGRAPVSPCQYTFPVATFAEAVLFAQTFTDLVLGTLQYAINEFATDGDVALAPLVGSIIGNEAEQVGYFRIAQKPFNSKVPSELPFLTRASGAFANSALNQLVLVPGTCPNATAINSVVPVFKPLSLATASVTSDTTSVQFSFQGTAADAAGYSLVYINQQNVPVVQQLQSVSESSGTVTFSASFDGSTYNGLTVAALTNSPGPFADADAVAAATVYGPGLIELN